MNIVLRNDDGALEIFCFDEAQAAFRFTELARPLNQLTDDLALNLDLPV